MLGRARTALARRASLPAVRPFLPFLLRARLDRRRGRPAVPVARWDVLERVEALPPDAVVVHRGRIEPDVVTAAAAACWGTARSVVVEWPLAAVAPELERWHSEVLSQALLPAIRIVPDAGASIAGAALVYEDGRET
jgi:hypothetical protein